MHGKNTFFSAGFSGNLLFPFAVIASFALSEYILTGASTFDFILVLMSYLTKASSAPIVRKSSFFC
ncbi:hypothetical protein HanXRQr2_Chr13g0604871 [Helianthus annuus]|uniref:Uncharacterized protein n=1 Tax=Helianthus annuus TaxID=4232 RepID=A0A9K3HD94_HELAN|nr:hypothetical protein HanXRQr2_Chr13g0604871 [Helianthus annuus]KAJ0850616.1 hypothetical protein HanPSC8_Chr13g0582881 [Helianthus annuus]